MVDIVQLQKYLTDVWNDPTFWAAGVVVLVYAFLRFNDRPTGQAASFYQDTDPVAPSRAFTTAFRYRTLQFSYVGIYALTYALIVIVASVPALRDLAVEISKIWNPDAALKPQAGVAITTWAATLLSVLLPHAPALSQLDNGTRGALHKAAAIPFKAQKLSREMREGAFRFNHNDLLRVLGRSFPTPLKFDAALKAQDSPLHDFVRLQYLRLAIDKLAERDPKFRAFVNSHHDNLDPIYSHLDKLREHVMNGQLAPDLDPYSGRAVQQTEFDTSLGELVRSALDDAFERLTRFLACALLRSSLTEESAYDQIEWLGFARPSGGDRIDILTPIYAFLITFSATLATSASIWWWLYKSCQGAEPQVELCSFEAGSLGIGRFIFWGLGAGAIHMVAIVCALVLRSRGRTTWRRGSTLEFHALSYGMILVVSWVVCNVIAYALAFAEPLFGKQEAVPPVDYNTLWAWGFVYATTGVCFAVLADWRLEFQIRRFLDATIQCGATVFVAWMAANYVFGHDGHGSYAGFPLRVVWWLTLFITAAIGLFLGFLPSHYRFKTARHRRRVAIIGAGIAGLSCAETLRHHGFNVTVFEKHLGAGGRVGSWKLDDLPFDLGAPSCSVSTQEFEAEVTEFEKDGSAAKWEGRHVSLRGGIRENVLDQSRRYVAIPTMNAISRRYAEHIGVQCETEISGVRKSNGGQWKLITRNGMANDRFDLVVAAIPAPEAAELFKGTGASFLGDLQNVKMTPRIVVAVAFDQELNLDFDSAHIRRDDDNFESPLYWIARDSSKPKRPPGERWVLHADDRWSHDHVNRSDAEVRESLLKEFWKITKHPEMRPVVHKVVRWKYAAVQSALRDVPPFDFELGLGACGDWCSGGTIEDAWINGRKMVDEIEVPWTLRRVRKSFQHIKAAIMGLNGPAHQQTSAPPGMSA